MIMFWVALVLCCSVLHTVESANILFVTTFPSHSHQLVFQPVWRELSLRGHNVTALAVTPLNDKSLTNLTEVDLSYLLELRNKVREKYIEYMFQKPTPLVVFIGELLLVDPVLEMHEGILSHPAVQKIIKEDYKFDVVIAEWIYPLAGAFAARFNCPLVGMTSLGAPLTLLETVGNPNHPLLAPDHNLPIGRELSFYDRIFSTTFSVFTRLVYHWVALPKIDKSVKTFFGQDMPYIGDIAKNVSVLLLNRNPVFHRIMPVVPAAVELGKVRSFKEIKPLNTELKEFMDKSYNGVVYFSLGTNIHSCDLPNEVREIFVKVFEKLPYNVVWKWEEDKLPGNPKNVFTQKWIPQSALLSHPNLKLFITHGGLQSMEETINNHVPVIGIPFQYDQTMNVDTAVKYGFGLHIEYEDLSVEKLNSAIHEIMTNKRYKEKAAEIAELINDFPMEGLEKAVWWIEYVIRHKGARHLRSPSLDIPWYQYFLLDVIALIGLVLFSSVYMCIKIAKLLILFSKKMPIYVKTKKE